MAIERTVRTFFLPETLMPVEDQCLGAFQDPEEYGLQPTQTKICTYISNGVLIGGGLATGIFAILGFLQGKPFAYSAIAIGGVSFASNLLGGCYCRRSPTEEDEAHPAEQKSCKRASQIFVMGLFQFTLIGLGAASLGCEGMPSMVLKVSTVAVGGIVAGKAMIGFGIIGCDGKKNLRYQRLDPDEISDTDKETHEKGGEKVEEEVKG
jgi:hypothetical protein